MKNKLTSTRILTIGGATVDIAVIVSPQDIEKMSMANVKAHYLLLEMGTKVEASSVQQFVGGGAVNAAVAMRRLGLEVDAMIKIGEDEYGATIVKHLTAERIGTRYIRTSETHDTATSIMVSSHDHNPTLLTCRGANSQVQNEDIPWDHLGDYDAIYISNLSDQSADVYPELLTRARAAKIKVISNPGIRQLYRQSEDFLKLVPMIDLLMVNKIEAEELLPIMIEKRHVWVQVDGESKREETKRGKGGDAMLHAGRMRVDINNYIAALIKHGGHNVVVTNGSEGAHIGYGKRVFHCQSRKVQAVGTAGAGDAFAATLSALWLSGHPLEQAAQLASINAAEVVMTVDTHTGLQNYDTLLKQNARLNIEVTEA